MKRRIRKHLGKFIFSLLFIVAGLIFWTYCLWENEITVIIADFGVYLKNSTQIVGKVPVYAYPIVVFFLPLFFLPVTPVFFLAGQKIANGDATFLEMYLACGIGLTLNIIVSYFIGGKFENYVDKLLRKKNIDVRNFSKDNETELITLVRLIPGNPLTVQNYLLGFLRVDFVKYCIFSFLIQYPTLWVYIYFGENMFGGNVSGTITAISLLIVISLLVRIFYKRYNSKKR